MDQYDHFIATVRFRRGDGFTVRPKAETLDGARVKLVAHWLIEVDDRAQYAGEWGCCPANPVDDWERWSGVGGWIASGDLVNVEMT